MTHHPRIKIGVIGAGKIGALHAKVLGKTQGFELCAVCDTNLWRAQFAATRCPRAIIATSSPNPTR